MEWTNSLKHLPRVPQHLYDFITIFTRMVPNLLLVIYLQGARDKFGQNTTFYCDIAKNTSISNLIHFKIQIFFNNCVVVLLATVVVDKHVEYAQPSVRRYCRLFEDIWELLRLLRKGAYAQAVFGLPALKNGIHGHKLIGCLWETY